MLLLAHADNRFTSAVTLSKVTHTTKRAFNNKTNRQEDLLDISLLKNEPSINIHLQWQNHSYFEYFALTVSAILHFYCRYDDGREKMWSWQRRLLWRTLIQNPSFGWSSHVQRYKARTLCQSSKWQTTERSISLKLTPWTRHFVIPIFNIHFPRIVSHVQYVKDP